MSVCQYVSSEMADLALLAQKQYCDDDNIARTLLIILSSNLQYSVLILFMFLY